MICQCKTSKGDRCKLPASKKSSDNNLFCWRHQDCKEISPLKILKSSIRSPKIKGIDLSPIKKTVKIKLPSEIEDDMSSDSYESPRKNISKTSFSPSKSTQKSSTKALDTSVSPLKKTTHQKSEKNVEKSKEKDMLTSSNKNIQKSTQKVLNTLVTPVKKTTEQKSGKFVKKPTKKSDIRFGSPIKKEEIQKSKIVKKQLLHTKVL